MSAMRPAKCGAAVLLAVLVAGCAQRAPEPAAAASTAEAATRAAYDTYVGAFWSKGDAAAANRALSPDMVYHYNGSVVPGDLSTHKEALRRFRAEIPDLAATTDFYVGDGDSGAAATTWTGTYAGEVCGKPTAKPLALKWAVNYVFRVQQGRIVELWETWDEAPLYRTLGHGPGACDARPEAAAGA